MGSSRVLLILFASAIVTMTVDWNTGLDNDLVGDVPAPTLEPFVSNYYPYFSLGSVPTHRGEGRSKDAKRNHSGRLDYRQNQCNDPTFILACPVTETLPCCPPDYPVCCHDPSDKCCGTGYFCVGLTTCCATGSTGCGEGCCPTGTACCGGATCCDTAAGYVCQSGTCANPTLSSLSVRSTQSVASVSSASIFSELSSQTREDGSDANTVNTVTVFPWDPRVEYSPPGDWVDTASTSGVGSCTNGTKATQKSSNFTFVFSGTAIALSIIPSANGGPFTVQIDAEAASTLNSKPASGAAAGTQCLPLQIFTRDSLTEKPHQIIITNGLSTPGTAAGTFEFNDIKYTGKGAFGTAANTSNDSKVSPAVIGGSVGGALGALILIGAGILFWLYRRKKRNNAASSAASPAPVSPNQPMMYQQQPGPYSPTSQAPGSPTHPGAVYGGMIPGQQQQQQQQYPVGSPQPSWNPQQQSYPSSPQQHPYSIGTPNQSWAPTQPQSQGYNDYNRPASGTSPAAAPLPMWVERPNRSGTADGMSVTTGEHTASPVGGQAYTAYSSH